MRYGRLVKETLAGHPVELVDLAGINEEELLFRDADVPAVVEKFRAADVDACSSPTAISVRRTAWPRWHGNSGCRCCCGGRGNDAPDAEGLRSRDSQCGLFATGQGAAPA